MRLGPFDNPLPKNLHVKSVVDRSKKKGFLTDFKDSKLGPLYLSKLHDEWVSVVLFLSLQLKKN